MRKREDGRVGREGGREGGEAGAYRGKGRGGRFVGGEEEFRLGVHGLDLPHRLASSPTAPCSLLWRVFAWDWGVECTFGVVACLP